METAMRIRFWIFFMVIVLVCDVRSDDEVDDRGGAGKTAGSRRKSSECNKYIIDG